MEESLMEEKARLIIALHNAQQEEDMALMRVDAGTLSFRLYLEYKDMVASIKKKLNAVTLDIMMQ